MNIILKIKQKKWLLTGIIIILLLSASNVSAEVVPIYKLEVGETMSFMRFEELEGINWDSDYVEVNGEVYTKYFNSLGDFFALEVGRYSIYIPKVEKSYEILVCDNDEREKKVCRAIYIANYDYPGYFSDLNAPLYDVYSIQKLLNKTGNGVDEEYALRNPTKQEINDILLYIAIVANPQDELYFYYSGHGGLYIDTYNSYLALTDGSNYDNIDLRVNMDYISGEKKLIIDACNSGGFINRGNSESDILDEFNKSTIKAFAINKKYGNTLDEGFYKVITACNSYETSLERRFEYTSLWYGVFTNAFTGSCGSLDTVFSDSNNDGVITTTEIQDYVNLFVQQVDRIYTQHVQVYPQNKSFLEYRDVQKYSNPVEFICEDNIVVSDEPYILNIATNCDDYIDSEVAIINMSPEYIQVDKMGTITGIASGNAMIKLIDFKNINLVKIVHIKVNIEEKLGKVINDKNKEWTIVFNDKVGKSYINVVYVDTNTKEEIDIKTKDKEVYISPKLEWRQGQYKIIINQETCSVSNHKLKEDYIFLFYVE